MRYYVRLDKLKEEGTSLRKFAEEEVDTKISRLLQIRRELDWESPAGNEFDELYKQMVERLYDIGGVMIKLGSFMEYCSEHYGEANEDVIKGWTEVIDELEEERKKRELEEMQRASRI